MVGSQIGVEAVVGFWLFHHLVFEESSMGGQIFICETSANLADALILLVLGIVAGQQEPSVPRQQG